MGFFGGFAGAMGDEAQKHLDQMTGEENDQRKNISDMYWQAIRNPETSDDVREHAFGQLEGLYRSPQAKAMFKQLRDAYQVGKAAHDQYHAQPGQELPAKGGQGMPKPPALLDKNAPGYDPNATPAAATSEAASGAPTAPAAPATNATPAAKAGAMPAGLPPPPGATAQDVTHAAYPNAQTIALVQQRAVQGSRQAIADSIDLSPKAGEPPSTEYQRFMATGTMPAAVSLRLLGDHVPGDHVPQAALAVDGQPFDPKKSYRLQQEPYSGTLIATVNPTAGEVTPRPIKYKGPEGQDLYGVFNNGKLIDQSGQPLPPGTEAFDASLAPTTSSTTAPHYTVDQNGNTQVNMGTSVSTRTRGLPPPPVGSEAGAAAGGPATPNTGIPAAGGAAAAPAAAAPAAAPVTAAGKAAAAAAPKPGASATTPLLGPDGKPLHKPLSAVAKNAIGQTTISLDLLDKIMPELDDIATGKDKNNLWDSAEQRSAWQQYLKLGVDPASVPENSVVSALPNIDKRLAALFPTIAMLQVVAAQPWLRNIRRFEFLQQVQQHLPDPEKDTPELMLTKLDNLSDTLPSLIRAAYEEEGITPDAYKPATVDEVKAYAAKSGQKYEDVAHALRRGGYKITRGK